MGKYTRKCTKSSTGGALMEVALVMENSGSSVKRRKVGDTDNGELRLISSKSERIIEAEDVFDDVSRNSGDDSSEKYDSSDVCRSSGEVPASCCSSNGSITTEKIKCSDLEEERAEIEGSVVRLNSDRRESTPSSELKEESDELAESKPSVLIDSDHSRREITIIPPEKTPPAAELEEFFASAEKNLHKTFKDKYNFDIVNDVPMKEGRFEWIQLKQ